MDDLLSKIKSNYPSFELSSRQLSRVVKDNNITLKITRIRHEPNKRFGKDIDINSKIDNKEIYIYIYMDKKLCCIPARYNSSRLPGKPLLKINNKTIINYVYEKAQQTIVDEIIVLTDDQRIYDEVLSFGGKCFIINEECLNGTERIISYLKNIDNSEYSIIVNIQGDEPFIKPNVINQAINNFIEKKPVCSTICFKTNNQDEILSKSRGKVVVDNFNNIIYCSRNIIPTNKKENIIRNHEYNIHVGIFVYDRKYLLDRFCKENTKNQLLEDIEWLKIIEQGFKINTIFSEEMERGVDTIEDYRYLKNKYEI